ncbi:hypothetical protein PsorP6_001502 [Peronosclerospora sorghi]|uniref:Uncharacterized protein n=1 Tax=Peronosclerospora sorghi TaxID=230839 RepID=A0ACC0WSC3_9STRA|nr:hypothetical protein PsorP6_001502 [Peronosclerospora sorghi]
MWAQGTQCENVRKCPTSSTGWTSVHGSADGGIEKAPGRQAMPRGILMPDSEFNKKLSVISLPDNLECVMTAFRKKRISASCLAVGFGTTVHVSECFRFISDIFHVLDFHPFTSCTNQRHVSSEHTYFLLLPPLIRLHSIKRLR